MHLAEGFPPLRAGLLFSWSHCSVVRFTTALLDLIALCAVRLVVSLSRSDLHAMTSATTFVQWPDRCRPGRASFCLFPLKMTKTKDLGIGGRACTAIKGSNLGRQEKGRPSVCSFLPFLNLYSRQLLPFAAHSVVPVHKCTVGIFAPRPNMQFEYRRNAVAVRATHELEGLAFE
jgi:hypothetical protein